MVPGLLLMLQRSFKMNPALMNYLQNNQMNDSQPQAQQGLQSARSGQDSYNPFDAGIQKAISSARASLGMTAEQEDRALRNSMLSFADNMSQQPRQKGFFNNFASAGRALSPAIQTYDQSEDAALAQNNALANQILAYQAAEQQKQAQQEERLWHRQHAENQLGEQRRYHDMMGGARGQNGQGGLVEYEGKNFRKLDKIEQRKANNYKELAGNTYLAVQNIDKAWQELEKLTKNNTFQPVGGYSGIANPVKDFFGKFGDKKSLQEETAARKNLSAQLGKLNTSLEALADGGGKLGQGMYDRLKRFFPDIENEDYKTVIDKFNQIREDSELYYKAAQLRSDLGISINPFDLHEMENEQLQGEQNLDQGLLPQEGTNNSSVLMQDQNGGQYMIPANEVEGALNDGLVVIEGQ